MQNSNGDDLVQIMWSDVNKDDVVYLYAMHKGKEYGCGPFTVVDQTTRILVNNKHRRFYHYAEHLYKLSV